MSAEQPESVPPPKERPHCHHYLFSHVALRQVAFAQPVGCLGVLASPNATAFLSDLWKDVDEHCRERGETSTIQPSEFIVHKCCVGLFPCAIVEMPEPWFITGAYFIAILLQKPIGEIAPNDPEVTVMYYTLEKTLDFERGVQTVLCDWTKDGTHRNYGTGPEPTLEAFVKELEKREAASGPA